MAEPDCNPGLFDFKVHVHYVKLNCLLNNTSMKIELMVPGVPQDLLKSFRFPNHNYFSVTNTTDCSNKPTNTIIKSSQKERI